MRLAVIQYGVSSTREEELDHIAERVTAAIRSGADVVVAAAPGFAYPHPLAEMLRSRVNADSLPSALLVVGGRYLEDAPHTTGPELLTTPLGRVALLAGDDCFRSHAWREALSSSAEAVVMSPASESDLQVEAALEVALALSESVAGLVIVAERAGAEAGEPGHGGSFVVLLGDVIAEAADGVESLIVDVPVPIPQPEPRDSLPAVPTLLLQRLAHHEGRRLDVDYPADLSEGTQMR